MTIAQREDRIDRIGWGLLGALHELTTRAVCPRCGHTALCVETPDALAGRVSISSQAVSIVCKAPSERRNRTEDGLCGYRRVVHAVRENDLPEKLVVAEAVAVRPKRTQRRRR